jgi:hypothetical protein
MKNKTIKKPTGTNQVSSKNQTQKYSNKISSQLQRLLQDLRESKQLSTFAGRNKGYAHVGGRICDLRKMGHQIVTNWTYEPDANGITHRIAAYTLIKEATPC